jgi:hypothetical protein
MMMMITTTTTTTIIIIIIINTLSLGLDLGVLDPEILIKSKSDI